MNQYTPSCDPQQNGSDVGSAPAHVSSAQPAPQLPLRPVRFATLAHTFDAHPVNRELDWSALLDALSNYEYRQVKEQGPLFSPATFLPSNEPCKCHPSQTGLVRKLKHCVEAVHFLALDFDDVPADRVTTILTALTPYQAYTYPTWKQPEASTKALMRFRAILPMSRSCRPEEWPIVYACAVRDFGASALDESCKDPNRFYFSPALPFDAAGNPCTWAVNTWRSPGTAAWDVDAALARPRQEQTAAAVPVGFKAGKDPIPKEAVLRLAAKLEKRSDPKDIRLGNLIRAGLDGHNIAPKGDRHVVLRDIAWRLAASFPTGDAGGLAQLFRLALDFMRAEGVAEDPLKHFADLITSAQRKVHEDAHELLVRDECDKQLGLVRGENGMLKPCLANAIIQTRAHFGECLAFDEFALDVTKRTVPPWGKEAGYWTTEDTLQLCAWLQSKQRLLVDDSIVQKAVSVVARDRSFHPIKDYLANLPAWDQCSRVPLLLAAAQIEPTEYARAVVTCFLISAVARVYEPGCKVDHELVHEGAQGVGKSTMWRVLFGDAWYSDSEIDLSSKDRYLVLQRKWGVEVAERDAFRGREHSQIKAYLSSQSDYFRPPFERKAVDVPRRNVFVSTTNEETYLSDPTGNRRSWPVRSKGPIDVAAVRGARDMVWSEALARYRAGEKWHLDAPELVAAARLEQEARAPEEAWDSPIVRWLRDREAEATRQGRELEVTIGDVLSGALLLAEANQTRAAQTRAGYVLRSLGWEARESARPRRYHVRQREAWLAAVRRVPETSGLVALPPNVVPLLRLPG